MLLAEGINSSGLISQCLNLSVSSDQYNSGTGRIRDSNVSSDKQ